MSDVDTTHRESQKQQRISQREESVKEKVFSSGTNISHNRLCQIYRFLCEIIMWAFAIVISSAKGQGSKFKVFVVLHM